jgi:hypothetical protein
MAVYGRYMCYIFSCIFDFHFEQSKPRSLIIYLFIYLRGYYVNLKLEFKQFCETIKITLLEKYPKANLIKFIYRRITVPTHSYGSECWTWNKEQNRRTETAEMHFVRSVAGYRTTHHERKENITEELRITDISKVIKELWRYVARTFGNHVWRTNFEAALSVLTEGLMMTETSGKRNGRNSFNPCNRKRLRA